MKKIYMTLIVALILSAATTAAYAQQPPIMVCNAAGTTCQPYSTVDSAITNAAPGSYIYLPGGNFLMTTNLISKELHFIGAGHYADSANVTGVTTLAFAAGSSMLSFAANNISFEGIYFNNPISIAASNNTNIVISRCNVAYFAGSPVVCTGCTINDCIIRNPSGTSSFINCASCTISNCIFSGQLNPVVNNINFSTISNCIFYAYGGIPADTATGGFGGSFGTGMNNNTVENNIFDSSIIGGTCTNCILKNNLTYYSSLGIAGAISQTGTITNVPTGNLFVTPNTWGFNYSYDYHLKSTSPGHNAGTDGKDVGIYGGTGHKDGGVPSNPHFVYKNVSNSTDGTGNLPVVIDVSAQN